MLIFPYGRQERKKNDIVERTEHTTMSFPAFSGLFASLMAVAAAAPDEIPTYKR